ncbi:MAG: FtsX-like permease family protein, partial [Nocardia sp.]|nr:FtsX-like permease family protein [Nocardia sp.]
PPAWVAGRFGSAGTLAGETIRRAPTRSWATLMTVSVSVAATFAIVAGNANAVDSTKDSFAALRDADIWVSTTPAGTFPTGPQLPADMVEQLGRAPGVRDVIPQQASYVSLGDQRALAFGVTTDSANPLVAGVSADVLAKVAAGGGVVLSRDLAQSLSLRAGDRLTLPTPTGTHQLPVLATVPYFSALNGAVALGTAQMRAWFDSAGASTVQVRVTPGTDAGAVLAEIRSGLPPGVQAYTGADAVQGFAAALEQATVLNHLIWIIVTIIAAVALLNTLMLSVLERRRELGVLRAIGSSRRFAIAMVLAEAAGIAIAGGVLGVLFGVVEQVVADMASSRAWNVDVGFAPVAVSFALAAGAFALCLLGSLPPAWQVSRVNIIKAMRVE